MDIEIRPGERLPQKLERELESCEVFIALIGRQWLTVADGSGRRLDNPEDFVRHEIATALDRGIVVIPVLVDGAQMPRKLDLPENILGLSDCQSFSLNHQSWDDDADRLALHINHMKKELDELREARRLEEPTATPVVALAIRKRRVAAVALVILLALVGASRYIRRLPDIPVQTRKCPVESRLTSQIQPMNGFINGIGIEFVSIEPGDLDIMLKDEKTGKPMWRRLTVGKGLYMGKYEVTQAQWWRVICNLKAVDGDPSQLIDGDPSHFKGDDLPVEQISWDDAQLFIDALNKRDGAYTYRLPTEVEWEYAARAKEKGEYPRDLKGEYPRDLDAIAPYEKNSRWKTHPVGSMDRSNGFGVYDMQGNVWEWCRDLYHGSVEGPSAVMDVPADSDARLSGNKHIYGVVRGGEWRHSVPYFRFDYRSKLPPNYNRGFTGLRLVAIAKS